MMMELAELIEEIKELSSVHNNKILRSDNYGILLQWGDGGEIRCSAYFPKPGSKYDTELVKLMSKALNSGIYRLSASRTKNFYQAKKLYVFLQEADIDLN